MYGLKPVPFNAMTGNRRPFDSPFAVLRVAQDDTKVDGYRTGA